MMTTMPGSVWQINKVRDQETAVSFHEKVEGMPEDEHGVVPRSSRRLPGYNSFEDIPTTYDTSIPAEPFRRDFGQQQPPTMDTVIVTCDTYSMMWLHTIPTNGWSNTSAKCAGNRLTTPWNILKSTRGLEIPRTTTMNQSWWMEYPWNNTTPICREPEKKKTGKSQYIWFESLTRACWNKRYTLARDGQTL